MRLFSFFTDCSNYLNEEEKELVRKRDNDPWDIKYKKIHDDYDEYYGEDDI